MARLCREEAKKLINRGAFHRQVVLEVVTQFGDLLCCAQPKLQRDEEVVLAAVASSCWAVKYVAGELLADDNFALEMVRANPLALRMLPERLQRDPDMLLAGCARDARCFELAGPLQNDPAFAFEAVCCNPWVLEFVPEAFKAQPELVAAAVAADGAALRWAPALRGERWLALTAVQSRAAAMAHVDPELLSDRSFVLEAVALQGAALQHAAPFQADEDLVLQALRSDISALDYSPLKCQRRFVLQAVELRGLSLQFVAELQEDREVVLAAVSSAGRALEFASQSLQKDQEVVWRAICQDPSALDFSPLREDKAFLLRCTSRPAALAHGSPGLLSEKAFAFALLAQDARAIFGLLSSDLQRDQHVRLHAAALGADLNEGVEEVSRLRSAQGMVKRHPTSRNMTLRAVALHPLALWHLGMGYGRKAAEAQDRSLIRKGALRGGGEPSDLVARCTQLADATVVGLRFSPDHAARAKIPPVRFHFVLDNSGSMGNNSLVAKDRFADLASVATLGVSLVSFDSSAQLLGTAFTTPQQLRDVKLPRQGGTNITAGIQSSLAVIRKFAAEEDAHHLLVLLSDGQHMTGPAPRAALPQMGAELKKDFPQLRLSVVVVGVTRSSDTSLGMLLKETLETAPLPDLQPIYFADSPQQMTTTLEQMHVGLTSLQGAMVTVSLSEGCFIRAGQDGEKTTQVLANEREQVLLCQGAVPNITVDGKLYEVEVEPFNASLITKALDDQLAAARIRRIASGAESVRPAVKQLGAWIRVLEKAAAPEKLNLAKASAKERLAQHRSLVAAAHGFRALRNQLAELDAYAANDSASQAAFLTGASRKYGAKALRRANDNEVNPEQRRRELIAEAKQLQPRMRRALLEDLCSKLCCDEALQRALPTGAVPEEVMRKICAGELPAEVDESLAEFLEGPVLQKVTANCRRSYVSLQTAMEQLHEWVDFNGLDSCDTEYELLMCLGTVGYPIDVKRRDATQMNPYAMDVTRLRPSAVDTASVCTAQHSEQPVVPVEGGAAIEEMCWFS
ncbi:unnamed protein product [Effrenium voratum]|uniref:VWFA domain-containing protein n=1 Tax=Effrenium voratum TaxID=2562239 RepID=A0AA36MYE8_9DINO|nr:unnamed protein product [Effrenium voratum]